jgi:hypothetical protein
MISGPVSDQLVRRICPKRFRGKTGGFVDEFRGQEIREVAVSSTKPQAAAIPVGEQ